MRYAAILLLPMIALGACGMNADASEGEAAGPSASRDYKVGAFDRVSLGGSHNVIVTVGGQHSVRAEGDAEQLERLEIEVEGGELHIGSKKNNWSVGLKGNRRPLTIHVTVPALAGASIGGSGDIRVDKVEGNSFEASIGGSGDIEIAALKVAQASFSVAGSGGIKASGSAGSSDVSIAGSGDVDLSGVEAGTAKVSVVGSGDVRARATRTADISIMGSGDVTMSGPARCTISKMGSGSVNCPGA